MSRSEHVPRQERRAAYLPVFVRRFRWLPLFRVDAQLLDLSEQGAKLQFAFDVKAKPGKRFWMEIPLGLIIQGSVGAAFLKVECRWYKPGDFSLGTSMVESSEAAQTVVSQLIHDLKAAGRLPC
jgi:hypothetical protein